ncbi:MAG: hypothetical protein JSS64_02865 [Bacteroidetes bacterium]|nr:hypothetical protein [Bacteroidota bacterium]
MVWIQSCDDDLSTNLVIDWLEFIGSIYSKPLKCGYNPYTGEWEEWSSNPLKQQTMDYYKTK